MSKNVTAEIQAGPDGKGSVVLNGPDGQPGLNISMVTGNVSVHITPGEGMAVAILNFPAVCAVFQGVRVELDAVTKAALERLGWKRA